jgi:hypothetical protein
MPNRGLNGGFRQAGLGGNGLQADRQGIPTPLCCMAQEIQINQEGRRAAIMADQVGHKHIHGISVQAEVLHR